MLYVKNCHSHLKTFDNPIQRKKSTFIRGLLVGNLVPWAMFTSLHFFKLHRSSISLSVSLNKARNAFRDKHLSLLSQFVSYEEK